METNPQLNGFSILVPTWNNLPYLQLCLESIFRNSLLNHQIIILVNEGNDGSKEWVESQPGLDSLFFKENVGICHALNAGVKLAKTDYVLFMNDDMYVLPFWDKVLKEEIEKIGHHYFFLSSTMIEPIATGNTCVIVKDYGNSLENFRKEELLKEYASLEKDDWNGATWPPNIMHQSMWQAVDGMSTEFSPGMYSDPDLAMKLWQQGVRYFKGLGKSKVYHFGARSTGRINQNNGKKVFLKKWGMTSGTFTRCYLRRGEKFNGVLPEPELNALQKLKNIFAKLTS